MNVESIADHPELIETIARWHWDEWGHTDPGGSLKSWTANLRSFTNRDLIPTIYVALDGGELLGSETLTEHDMSTHLDLSPWLAGVYVKPAARGRGVARGLVRHAMEEAGRMGIRRLYLYTRSARGLYERLGWQTIEEDDYEGRVVTIMNIETGDREWSRGPALPCIVGQ
jgi:GNAT superfamily N-acetyltransferase